MDLHPHWFYIFWSDIHNELLAKCIGYQDIMRGRSGIQKADLSRLMYLHKYGGFYSDMDYIALLDHEQLFDFEDNDINSNHDIDNDNNHGHDLKHQMVLLQGRQEQVVGLEWGFARQPEHPIWKFCLDIANRQKDAVRTQCPIFYTGPKFLARCLKKYYNLKSQGKELEHMVSYGNEVMILEPNLIAPIGANDFDSECGKWRSVGVGVGVGIGVGVVGVDEEDSQEQVWMGKWPTSACRQNLIKNGTYAVTIYTHSWGEGLKC